jgi:outer membrane scaffolding protein for murein synthesis (MipA/OmpV family)
MKISRLTGLCLVLLLVASPVWALDGMAGLGVGMAPDYEGSEDSTGVPMFMFQHNYDSGRFVKLMGPNLKVNLLANKQFSLGPVLNYRPERDDVDNDRVDDMKKVDAALEAGVFGGVNIDNLLFGLELLADVSDEHDGFLAQANAGYKWQATPDLTLTPGVFVTYADSDYMDTYFSIDASNRGGSGLPNYSADSGFKDVGINLVAHYTPWEKWGIMGLFSYKALLNDAKDSPIVDDEGDDKQFTLGLMATYRWKK